MLLAEAKKILERHNFIIEESNDEPELQIRNETIHIGDIVRKYYTRYSEYGFENANYYKVAGIKNRLVYLKPLEYDKKLLYKVGTAHGFSMGTYGNAMFAPKLDVFYTIENPVFSDKIKVYKVDSFGYLYDVSNSSRGRKINYRLKKEDLPKEGEEIYYGEITDKNAIAEHIKEHPELQDMIDAEWDKIKSKR